MPNLITSNISIIFDNKKNIGEKIFGSGGARGGEANITKNKNLFIHNIYFYQHTYICCHFCTISAK